ncbi:MAG: tryptophan 2,3-dioxygenase family protein [Proteobacteria bacterium]|nr:tryptophan 2,3-dioxygenase family protein [Pseudomonadota bacterium]
MAATDYEKYMRTDKLFALLPDRREIVSHGEFMFHISHLTAELWMQVIFHDVDTAVSHLARDELSQATDLFQRAAMIEEHLANELALVEKMPPLDYALIRHNTLGKGRGQDSPGFIQMLGLGDVIWPHVVSALERHQTTIVDVLTAPDAQFEMYVLLRSLFELDQWFQTWRFGHLRLAERQMGARARTLNGSRVDGLMNGVRQRMLPELWDAVNEFSERTTARAAQNRGRLEPPSTTSA